MRIGFQRRPWDLHLVMIYTVVVTVGVLFFGGDLLGLLFLLFVPGYVIVSTAFPSKGGLDWIERIALSLALSIAVIPLLGLGLNFTPLGIQFGSILATLSLFSLAVGGWGYGA